MAGNASDSEWEEYLKWMDGEGEEEPDPVQVPDMEVRQRSWEVIQSINQNYNKSRIRKRWVWQGLAAACITFLCVFALFHFKGTASRQYEVFTYNTLRPAIEKEFNGINVRLAKDSEIIMNQEGRQQVDVRFTGVVMLSNTSNEDQYIIVKADQTQPGQALRKMCLKKGQSYLLSYYTNSQKELLIVDRQRLLDIPPAMALNMRQDFNL